MSWDEFINVTAIVFSPYKFDLNPFKPYFGRSIVVKDKLVFVAELEPMKNFFAWFPLARQANYQNSDQLDVPGYNIADVIEIVKQPWFHGKLDPQQAHDLLVLQPPGTFLLRFSSTPTCFALSVNYSGKEIGHWRITSERFVNKVIYKIDTVVYSSLYDIIEKHSKFNTKSKPLNVKTTTGEGMDFYLAQPLKREESIYDESALSSHYNN